MSQPAPQSVFRRVLVRLSRQRPADWRDLFAAQLALLAAQLLVWTRPAGQLVSEATSPRPASGPVLDRDSVQWRDARRTATAVRRAANYGLFRPKCLVRSVALSHLLERRGIRGSRVTVGVQRRDGQFMAHAWVELGGHVLGDDRRHTTSFTHLVDVQVVR